MVGGIDRVDEVERVGRDWCEANADRYGVSAETLVENLYGASVGQADAALKRMEDEEMRMRLSRGVKYAMQHFSARRSLRNYAKAHGLGGWTKTKR